MPITSRDAIAIRRSAGRRSAPRRGHSAALRAGVLMVCGAVLALSGCRMFSRSATNERLVASRRMSLQGTDALQRGHWEEAESLFGAAVKNCAVDERARAGYAEALWQRGACDQAIQEMEQACQLAGSNPDLLVRLGEMRQARGDIDGAKTCAEQALDRQRQCASAWALQGNILRAQRKYDDALNCYHRALHCDGGRTDVQLAIAELYTDQDRPRRALSSLEALVDSYGPGRAPPQVLVQQGIAQQKLGRHDEAVASFLAASKQGPPSVDILKQLSQAQMLAGDAQSARKTTLEALHLAPSDPALKQFLSQLEVREQQMAAAGRGTVTN
ncbi:MAG: tetratricopeptide repeat protein [Pirellulales bacterium]